MSGLRKVVRNGEDIYISSLEMLQQDNYHFNQPERVRMIEKQMKKIIIEKY